MRIIFNINKTNKLIFLYSLIIFHLVKKIFSRPFITITDNRPNKEEIISKLYECSCNLSEESFKGNNFYGGYSPSDFPLLRRWCIKIEENGEIEKRMQDSNMFISLEDPLSSSQYIWTISRIKYNLYLFESDCFHLWKIVLLKLKVISEPSDLEYKPEYDIAIRSRPAINGPVLGIREFPVLDDILLMLSLATLIYKKGKFAADFTKNGSLNASKFKQSMTPLIYSNIDYYIPVLMKLYTPSFEYKNLITSVSFVYRLIFYSTASIISPKEAWEIWGLVMSWGGGGFIPEYAYKYQQSILSQDPEDKFPEERNFLTVIEKLSNLQSPPWNIEFPPMYQNTNYYEKSVLYKFIISKGYSLLNKHTKDTEGIAIVYYIFHYLLNTFISITTSRDIWMVSKRWLSISIDIPLSSKIKFIQYDSRYFSRNIKLEKVGIFVERPRLATGSQYVDVYSEIMLTHLSEFENEFPYTITCPNGELILKNNIKEDTNYGINSQSNHKVDLFAIKIAKEIHVLFPTVKFSDICELAYSFVLIVPFNFKLRSKLSKTVIEQQDEDSTDKEQIEVDDSLIGMEYCKKGIINLLEESDIILEEYDDLESLHIKQYLEAACKRILKSQLKCNLSLPYYFPADVTSTFSFFAGNIANVMSSSFTGRTYLYDEVIGSIWDGKVQSLSRELNTPSFYRLRNVKSDPENFCKFAEGFVQPAIINYFEEKKYSVLNKKGYSKKKRDEIAKRIIRKYFSKEQLNRSLVDVFNSDLISLKGIINAHRIPRGATLKHWIDFYVDENTISSFITRQFKKLSDFETICKIRLEKFIREGKIQFHPISKDVNIYKEFLLNKKKRSKLIFQKIVKDDQLDPNLKEISNFLIFKHETLGEVPEKIANYLMNSLIFEQSDQQFKNIILWYINDSCQKAYKLISDDMKNVKNSKFSTDNFIFNCCSTKSDNEKIENSNPNISYFKIVQEALEFGLKAILKNPIITLDFYIIQNLQQNSTSEIPEIKLNENILDKNFVITNANYLYFYMMQNFVPISQKIAFKASKIASFLLKNYYLHGEIFFDNDIVYVSTENNQYENVGVIIKNDSQVENNDIMFINFCDSKEITEKTIKLFETLTYNRDYLIFNDNVMDWRQTYLNKESACNVVQLLKNFKGDEKPKNVLVRYFVTCIKIVMDKYPYWPHISIPICDSQGFLLDCEDNNFQNFLATIMFSNLPVNDDFDKLKNLSCYYSTYIQLFYRMPDFINNCLNLIKYLEFDKLLYKLYNITDEKVKINFMNKICHELNFSHNCKNINNIQYRKDVEKIADIIQYEIMNELTDYNIIFKKNMFCKISENIVISDMENCLNVINNTLKLFNYDFPKNFNRTICLKFNFWPRRCNEEYFSNHSLFATHFYNIVTHDLQKNKSINHIQKIKNSYFTDICDILKLNYMKNKNKNNDIPNSNLKININELCNIYIKEVFLGESLNKKRLITEKIERCISILSKDFESINNDKIMVDLFDPSDVFFVETVPFFPSYMLEGDLADKLINNFRLPPRLSLISIALYLSLKHLNFGNKMNDYKFSIFGVLYNSLKILLNNSFSQENFYNECIFISKEIVSPIPDDLELGNACRNALIAYKNSQFRENIYLLYSLNTKVSSYYTTEFTSENINFISKQYISKILRGKLSERIQEIYEKVFYNYVEYMLDTGFISQINNLKDGNNNIAKYKRTRNENINISTSKIIKERIGYSIKENKEYIFDNENKKLIDFLDNNTYEIKIGKKLKHKLIKSIIMFNFLLEIKRLKAFQIHSQVLPSQMVNEITFDSLMIYLPPDIANWLTSYENLIHVNKFFVIPIELQEKNILGTFSNLDIENNIQFEKLSKIGIIIDKNIYTLSNKYKVIGEEIKNEISPEILTSTIEFLIKEKEEDININYSFNIANNAYLFENGIKEILINSLTQIILEDLDSLTITKPKFTTIEAISYFIETDLISLRSKLDFNWINLSLINKFHKDSFRYYNLNLNSEELIDVRRKIFCKIFNEQITYGIESNKNPFFTCNYYIIQNDNYKQVPKHQEGKTLKVCLFKGKATKAKKMGDKYMNKLLDEYLKFLYQDNYYPYQVEHFISSPELIMRAIGRIYGHCLLYGEPVNLNFHSLIFNHFTNGETNNELEIKDVFDTRISTYQKIISLSYGGINAKLYKVPRMNFENAKKSILNNKSIYYDIDNSDDQIYYNEQNKFNQKDNIVEIKNFNNLRFLKRNITRFVTYEKFQVELESFTAGLLDIVPRRFLRKFHKNNLLFYTQGYSNPSVKNISFVKNYLTSFFYVENNELLLSHKRELIQQFFLALNSLTYIDIGYFFSIFTNQFSVMLPTAYVGKIKIVEIPLKDETNSTERIVIDPLLMIVYIPNYKSYKDFEDNIHKVINLNKKRLNILD